MAKRPKTKPAADSATQELANRREYESAEDYAREIAARPRWLDIFAIDARSLGIFRVALGVWLLWDLLNRAADLTVFYSDLGVMPRFARIAIYDMPAGSDRRYWFSFHMMCGEPWILGLLFAAAAFVYFHLIIGYRTKLFTLLSFVFACSLQSRNPSILDGGDDVSRVLLFWSLFLPLGGRFSVDRWIGTVKEVPTKLLNLATFALLSQVGMIYLFGAFMKDGPEWRSDFTATWYALQLDCFTTAFGRQLAEWGTLLKLATFGTMMLEAFGPLLLLIPWRNDWIRLAVIAGFWSFHIGIACTMHIGLFPVMGCIAWLPFLPARVWERDKWPGRIYIPTLGRNRDRLRIWRDSKPWIGRWAAGLGLKRSGDYAGTSRLGWSRMVFIAVCWIYVVLWNTREVHKEVMARMLPAGFDIFGRALRLDQNWKLFAPAPLKDDGWYVFRGTLKDGTQVNLWDLGQKIPMEKPEDFAALYRNTHWRKYLLNLWYDDYIPHRKYLCAWLAERFMAWSPRGNELEKVEMIFMREETQPPGWAGKPIEPVTLWVDQIRR